MRKLVQNVFLALGLFTVSRCDSHGEAGIEDTSTKQTEGKMDVSDRFRDIERHEDEIEAHGAPEKFNVLSNVLTIIC